MKPNKALQSTQSTQTTSNSNQVENVQNSPISGLCGGDNTTRAKRVISKLMEESIIRHEVMNKYGLQNGGYDLLILISYRWIVDGLGSTAYAVTGKPRNSTITATQKALVNLLGRGLVEVVGYGGRKAFIYAPTNAVIIELGPVVYAQTA